MNRSVTTIVGGNVTICISGDGNLFSFGYSKYGALGHDEEFVSSPRMIPTLHKIKSISIGEQHRISGHYSGGEHVACLDYNGNLYTFGNNHHGQLGIGAPEEVLAHTHVPQKVNLPPCKHVCCGNTFVVCLTEDGELFSFGLNNRGQLGLGWGGSCFLISKKD